MVCIVTQSSCVDKFCLLLRKTRALALRKWKPQATGLSFFTKLISGLATVISISSFSLLPYRMAAFPSLSFLGRRACLARTILQALFNYYK
jgi:hypothetical protein